MKTKSAKAKGRRVSVELKSALLRRFLDLSDQDIWVTPSSVTGPDLWFSSAAQKRFPFAVECKNQEKLNIWSAFSQAESHAQKTCLKPLLAFRRNGEALKVCLNLKDFLSLIP